ncbi:hypothetical protein P154DRAFT_444512 [Amniculicola lignicola CBS 123094]|uniref:ABM domain-containing protein n=1 Tax=Amniculicola lignicola CBS 123094 TaxID=1392246 RepID=A0A6A5W4L7_9PLEO|nr:hypothetical protein P154DRAFT_444512 [Amniculicola lignicola CBS 123094]
MTEIALLRILRPIERSDLGCSTRVDSPTFQTKLALAKQKMEEFSGRKFYFLQEVEDPSHLYIIGEWDDLGRHLLEWLPSQENQSLLHLFKNDMKVEWMFHIDATHTEFAFARHAAAVRRSKENLLGITRFFVKPGKKHEFNKEYDRCWDWMQHCVKEGKVGGGWRIDRDGDQEEFVLITPWKNLEQHEDTLYGGMVGEFSDFEELFSTEITRHARVMILDNEASGEANEEEGEEVDKWTDVETDEDKDEVVDEE